MPEVPQYQVARYKYTVTFASGRSATYYARDGIENLTFKIRTDGAVRVMQAVDRNLVDMNAPPYKESFIYYGQIEEIVDEGPAWLDIPSALLSLEELKKFKLA